ncbi:WbqC family protein [Massilibacteroides sp.]|uniref:WbqC family protein n=1 Tax=Massilibacteroides sp. TaxID=2034766 RepID=UPI0026063829|nr:WbqC family protein [Massilibacteroides sp.]MDD4515898.1 WbqC family protein [Massilibacteroides sp.]
METAYLCTAYLAPVQYYCKLLQYPAIKIEREENYLKQTYRNRCVIGGANGALSLSVPIEKPETIKCQTKDIRISEHGNWRHLHWNALVSAYGTSPFFEYYQDDFIPFYEKKYDFLFDFNEELRSLICSLLDIEANISYTEKYELQVPHDFREIINPKSRVEDREFTPTPYYQVFREKNGFLPNLSIVDLLFNMGPEGLLTLRQSVNK